MQEPRQRVPAPNLNLIIGALLGIPGLYNLITGVLDLNIGYLLCGVAALVYALLLVRDALHIKKHGVPAMAPRRTQLIGFGCLAVYLAGLLAKHA